MLLEALAKTTVTVPPDYWIIDETSFPKAGSHSTGMQRQYCGALGKTANCQLAVSLHRADEAGGTTQPLAWRLFLPESWAEDPARCERAPEPGAVVLDGRTLQSSPESSSRAGYDGYKRKKRQQGSCRRRDAQATCWH